MLSYGMIPSGEPARMGTLAVLIMMQRAAASCLIVAICSLALSTSGPFDAREAFGRSVAARAARTLDATDTAHLNWIHSSGSLLYEEGWATGDLPGKMRAHCDVGPVVTADFTIYVRGGGVIYGRGSAKAHGTGRYQSFAGTLVVTHGSGRYTHAHGRAGLYGVFDRRTYALTVQTTGRLFY